MEAADQDDVLRIAEELRIKRDAERGSMSKSQLKKARRKLSKLFKTQQATGFDLASESSFRAESCNNGGPDHEVQAGVEQSSVEDTQTQVTETLLPDQHTDASLTEKPQQQSREVRLSRFRTGSLSAMPIGQAIHNSIPASRGQHVDMSCMVRMLHVELNRPVDPTHSSVQQTSFLFIQDSQPLSQQSREAINLQMSEQKIDTLDGVHLQQQILSVECVKTEAQQPVDTELQADEKDCSTRSQQAKNPKQQTGRTQQEYIYGNYHGYYGYRHAGVDAFDDDPRLSVLKATWFAGKHMLDVGCNEGLVTLAVAMRFGCASTTGVDIDRVLVGKACRNLKAVRQNISEQLRSRQNTNNFDNTQQPHTSSATAEAIQNFFSGGGTADVHATTEDTTVCNIHGTQEQRIQLPVGGVPQQLTNQPGSTAPAEPLLPSMPLVEDCSQCEADMPTNIPCDAQQPPLECKDANAPIDQLAEYQDSQGQTRPNASKQVALKPQRIKSIRALRAAARALASVKFYQQDWANEDPPVAVNTYGKVISPRVGQIARIEKQPHPQQPKLRHKFGVIMCLSVTKWIHLNWGDEGLMRLFRKFHASLEPGGYLVLEPQPWRSYKAARVKKQTKGCAVQDMNSLHLRPENFVDVLSELGFTLLADLNKNNTAAGFDRPMYVFQKPICPQPSKLTIPVQATRPMDSNIMAAPQGQAATSQQGNHAGSGGSQSKRNKKRHPCNSTSSKHSSNSTRKRQRSGDSGMTHSHRRQPRAEDLLCSVEEGSEGEEVMQQH